jgi:tripartite-type tricarboxylate transporter receptor subunit TctC
MPFVFKNPSSAPSWQRLGLSLSLMAAAFLNCAFSQAQTFPTKPIRLVVTFTPGGAPDILARLFSE